MALLREDGIAGVQRNFSDEFFPPVAESKENIMIERAGRCPMRVLYKTLHDLIYLPVIRSLMLTFPNDLTVWSEGKIIPFLTQ